MRLVSGRAQFGVFEQRIEFEADIAVVAAGALPYWPKHVLSLADQLIRHSPGDCFVVRPSRNKPISWPSNWPVLSKSATIIGLEVSPVAPNCRLTRTSSGSIESSQSLVPVAIRDSKMWA